MADAENSYRLSESLRPPDSPEATWIVLLRIATGDAEAALAMAEGRPRAAVRLLLLAMAYHALGDDAATDAALEELTERYPGWDLQIAAIHAMRGELDTAFDWLDRSYQNGHPMLPYVLTDPGLANLHDDRRWSAFVDKIGLSN